MTVIHALLKNQLIWASSCAALAVLALIVFATFVPSTIRRRDWKMGFMLLYANALFGTFLFVCIRIIIRLAA